jgi:hypothetical protein
MEISGIYVGESYDAQLESVGWPFAEYSPREWKSVMETIWSNP